jgi:hypothetical protein
LVATGTGTVGSKGPGGEDDGSELVEARRPLGALQPVCIWATKSIATGKKAALSCSQPKSGNRQILFKLFGTAESFQR